MKCEENDDANKVFPHYRVKISDIDENIEDICKQLTLRALVYVFKEVFFKTD